MPTFHALRLLRQSPLLAAISIALACPAIPAQSASATSAATPAASAAPAPAYDVATIKPHQGIFQFAGLEYSPDGFAGTVTLSMLVQYAYGLRSVDQVSGGPDWAKTDWLEIQAKMSEADIAEMQKLSSADADARRHLMLQALLSERFKLKVHSETKQVKVFDLVVAKGGPKLKDASTDPNPPLGKGKDGKPLDGFLRWSTGKIIAQGYSTKSLAEFLSQPMCALGRPVIDKTELTGTYNFTLDWTPPHPGVRLDGESDSALPDDAPSIFTALGELGLKLRPATGPIDIVVIDHVEHPTAN